MNQPSEIPRYVYFYLKCYPLLLRICKPLKGLSLTRWTVVKPFKYLGIFLTAWLNCFGTIKDTWYQENTWSVYIHNLQAIITILCWWMSIYLFKPWPDRTHFRKTVPIIIWIYIWCQPSQKPSFKLKVLQFYYFT